VVSGRTVGDAIQLFGNDAVARRNQVKVGPATGYALRVRRSNIVYCDNTADPAS
jgi:hypothetical protein